MLLRRFACAPLAQSGYVLADGDEAIVVDPLRDADEVLAFCRAKGLRVRWVTATHVHADFVTGLGEVAAATGATPCLGERFTGSLPCRRLPHGHELPFGDRFVRVLETPGHTPDSICLFVDEPDGTTPPRLLTGDTLFVGDVGRPDLVAAAGQDAPSMAAQLFASLQTQLADLTDETEVWPAHGEGSLCGGRIGGGSHSTLGTERRHNWALQERDPERFAARLLASLSAPPRHFARVAQSNRAGVPLLAVLADPPGLTLAEATSAMANGTVVLDVRGARAHGRGHWPGAIAVGVDDGEFEPWAGALLPETAVVVHASDAAQAERAWRRLRRVGRDQVAGCVFELPVDLATLRQIEAIDLYAPAGDSPWQVVDVRRRSEFVAGHVPGAVSWELAHDMLEQAPSALDPRRPTALLCEGGYRSRAAAHLLAAHGFVTLANVADGMPGWRRNHLPLTVGERPA